MAASPKLLDAYYLNDYCDSPSDVPVWIIPRCSSLHGYAQSVEHVSSLVLSLLDIVDADGERKHKTHKLMRNEK